MRLNEWARAAGVSASTARRWWRAGALAHLRISQPAGPGTAIDVDIRPPTIICGVTGENIVGRPLSSDYYTRRAEALAAAFSGSAPFPSLRWP
jgi:hypothetical protein